MKKLSLLAIILIATCSVAIAQPRAIGGRIGWNVGASYQHGFGEKNMLQADLDFVGFWGIQGTVTYNWLFPINSWSGPGSWNWYAGVGGGLGCRFWGWGYDGWGGYGGRFFAGVAGMIGVEYNFKFPLQLSLDYRPLIGPSFGKGGVGLFGEGLWTGFAIGVRYKF